MAWCSFNATNLSPDPLYVIMKEETQKENPLEIAINILKEQVSFCDKKIEEFIRVRDSRKHLLEVYQNRQ